MGMNLQLIPDMDMPIQLVMCTYPGASPEDVEKLVTKPMEDSSSTISGVETVVSYSLENLGLVMLSFDYGTNMDKAFIDIMRAMEIVKYQLPEDASDPTIISMDVNATASMSFSVETDNPSLDTLSYVNEIVTPELDSLNDIAQIDVSGGKSEYISVELVPELLSQYRLNINTVASAVKDANFTIPVGTAEYGGQSVNATSTAEYKTPEQINTIPITTPSGDVIHLSDVANVHYAYQDQSSFSRFNGGEDISVSITKSQSASAVTLSKQVNKIIERLNEENPDYVITTTYDSAETIVSSLTTLGQTLILGIAITMIILLLFFGDIKGSLIVASSMPVSVLFTFVLMSFMGFSLNMMTMGAMVIAIGMMVDNSIVVVEMCFRKQEEGEEYFDAALNGTGAVLSSIVASTITTVVVYLPLALMEGLSGQLFAQLGYTIVFALIASLISAVTMVPLCFYIYKPKEKEGNKANHILNNLGNKYANVIRRVLRFKKTTALAAIGIFIVSVVLFQFVNMELMPASDEGRVSIRLTFRPGTNVEIIDEEVRKIETFVAESPYVESYSSSSGGGSGMFSAMSSGGGSVSANIKKDVGMKTQEVVDEWIPALTKMAKGYQLSISSSSSTSGMTGLGGGNTYDVNLKSRDLDTLKNGAVEVAKDISGVPGVISVSSSLAQAENRAEIIVDPVKAAAAGLTPKMAAGTVYSLMNGVSAFDVTINDRDYQVTVEYPNGTFKTVNDIYGITLTNTRGMEVPLSDVAEIVFTDSPTTIQKTDGMYNATVTATMDSATKYEIQKSIDEWVEGMSLPAGVSQATNSLNEIMNEEFRALAGAIIAAIILVYMVMAIQFNNLIYSAVVMFCIPFSIIGSVVMLLITRATLNMTSLMGFLMLIGIVVNNGIIYVDYANMLREEGKEIMDALVETGVSRLRPILMTTLTTILSMIPMGLGIGRNGQLTQGMAMVIIGGLTASTILTLVLLPDLYLIVNSFRKKKNKKA